MQIHTIVKVQRAKVLGQGQKPKRKGLRRLWRAGGRIVGVEVVSEPAAAPVPALAIPAEAADTQAANRVAINRSPEEDVLTFPLFGDQLGVCEQVVQNIGVEHRPACQFLAEFVSLDVLTALLVGRQMEPDFRWIPLQLSALLVALHSLPSFGQERIGVAIDDVFNHDDLRRTINDILKRREVREGPKLRHVVGSESRRLKRVTDLIHLTDGIQSRHRPLPF